MTEPTPASIDSIEPEPIASTDSIEPADEAGRIEVDTSAADDEVPQTLEQARKLRSENRSLRQRLHAAEAANTELESAVTRLSALEHAEVERIAAQDLIDGSDVWAARPDLQSFYDDEFRQIVPDKVREATAAIIAAKPHLARPNTAPPPTDRPIEGLRGGASPEPKKTEIVWQSALRRSI